MNKLSGALHTLAGEVPAPPLPPDLWRRGRRRHRRRQAVGAAAVVLVLVALVLPVYRGDWTDDARPADTGPAIPSSLRRPLPWQPQVADAPAGPATMIVSGSGPLRGSDVFDNFEGRTLVVARDGRYRLVDGLSEDEAGTGMHLSPDGRLLAVAGPVEGGESIPWNGTSLIDLTTGRVRAVRGGTPIGWAPDSRHLLLADREPYRIVRYDVVTGSARELGRIGGVYPVPPYVVFMPDAFHFRVITGAGHIEFDETGPPRGPSLNEPGRNYRLAGPSAVAPDGRIAHWEVLAGCSPSCDDFGGEFGEFGEFGLVFGAGEGPPSRDATGFDRVTGLWPRLLGWLPDGSAVVEVREAVAPATDPPTGDRWRTRVVALKPGGGRTTLIEPQPAYVHHVDLARDLVTAGRFGADPPPVAAYAADWVRGVLPFLLMIAAGVAAVVGLRMLRRRSVRSRPEPG